MKMDRRTFMQQAGLGGVSLSLGARASLGREVKKKPNIVLIMADDMGYSDIGCYGGEVKTPHLDSLARNGLRFTQFYNTSRCCPTRASLLTGLYSHQAGVGHMVGNKGVPSYQGYLNKRCVTIAEALKPAGYNTLMAGKWHVGNQKGHWPCDRGFDRFYGSNTSPGNYYQVNDDNYDRRLLLDDEEVRPPEAWYCTDAFTDYAIEFMRDNQQTENPFFLYLAYTAPHWPLHALPADVKTYRGRYKRGWEQVRKERYERMVDMGLVKPAWDLSPLGGREWDSLTDEQKDEMDLKMAVYAAMIDRMDQNIGRVVRALKEMGAYENTLILFLSDNGGCHEGGQLGFDRKKGKVGGPDSYSSYGLCWANVSNTPYRRYKSWVHEGGISTPLIAHWPGVVAKNTWSGQVGHVIDLMATCCDIAGAAYPKKYNGNDILPLQGKSLLPVLQGKQRKGHDALFWEHQGNQAIRQGKWKLVRKHKSDWALFDLVKDRTELNDLASRYPERVASMREAYKNWMQRCGVKPWPVKK